MSTRSTAHFVDSSYIDPATNKPFLSAIIYRHADGYPEGAGKDMFDFLRECKKLRDSRLSDCSYLSAKYVVFLADMFNKSYSIPKSGPNKGKGVWKRNTSRLDFISVGVMMSDPGDIEYRYVIDCGKIDTKTGLPEVKCFKVNVNDDGTDKYCIETAIPGETTVAEPKDAADTWINQIDVRSSSDRNVSYTVEQNLKTLAWRCNCQGFKFRKTCKHLNVLPFNRRQFAA